MQTLMDMPASPQIAPPPQGTGRDAMALGARPDAGTAEAENFAARIATIIGATDRPGAAGAAPAIALQPLGTAGNAAEALLQMRPEGPSTERDVTGAIIAKPIAPAGAAPSPGGNAQVTPEPGLQWLGPGASIEPDNGDATRVTAPAPETASAAPTALALAIETAEASPRAPVQGARSSRRGAGHADEDESAAPATPATPVAVPLLAVPPLSTLPAPSGTPEHASNQGTTPNASPLPALGHGGPASEPAESSVEPVPYSISGEAAPPSAHASEPARMAGRDEPRQPDAAVRGEPATASPQVPTAHHSMTPAATVHVAPEGHIEAAAAPPAAVQIGTAVLELARAPDGQASTILHLSPEELGRVEIRLTQAEGGHAALHISAERPETLALLRQDETGLRQALGRAGMAAETARLEFQLAAPAEIAAPAPAPAPAQAQSSGQHGFEQAGQHQHGAQQFVPQQATSDNPASSFSAPSHGGAGFQDAPRRGGEPPAQAYGANGRMLAGDTPDGAGTASLAQPRRIILRAGINITA